jgi:hypothetical protein
MTILPAETVAALFMRRQHLENPLSGPFTQGALTRFVGDAGGLQLNSIATSADPLSQGCSSGGGRSYFGAPCRAFFNMSAH